MPKSRRPYCIGQRYIYAASYQDARWQASWLNHPTEWRILEAWGWDREYSWDGNAPS